MRNNKMELRMAMADFNNTTEMVEMFDEYEMEEYSYIWGEAKKVIADNISKFEDIVEMLKNHRLELQTEEDREEMGLVEYSRHLDNGDEGYSWDFYSDWFKDVFGFRPRW